MERDQASKFMFDLLRLMVSKKGSDLFITAGFPPAIKIDGKMTPVSAQALTPAHTSDLARSIMNDKQTASFEQTKEANFAISPGDLGRFRVSAFVQMSSVGMVLRTINSSIPEFDELGLPPVLKDVMKTTVYRLADHCNRSNRGERIPREIIDKPPSAELRPNQLDTDSLPPYDVLDPILKAYVEEDRSFSEMIEMGFDEALVRRVIRMVDLNEYKRRQAAPGVKITPRAFGRDRRMPITNRFRQ